MVILKYLNLSIYSKALKLISDSKNIFMPHDNKYFIFLKEFQPNHLPDIFFAQHYVSFMQFLGSLHMILKHLF